MDCRCRFIALLVSSLVFVAAVAGQKVPDAPNSGAAATSRGVTIADVINMAEAGVSDDAIILMLGKSGFVDPVTPAVLIRLKSAKISDAVVQAMLRLAPGNAPVVESGAARTGAPRTPPKAPSPEVPLEGEAKAAVDRLLNSILISCRNKQSGTLSHYETFGDLRQLSERTFSVASMSQTEVGRKNGILWEGNVVVVSRAVRMVSEVRPGELVWGPWSERLAANIGGRVIRNAVDTFFMRNENGKWRYSHAVLFANSAQVDLDLYKATRPSCADIAAGRTSQPDMIVWPDEETGLEWARAVPPAPPLPPGRMIFLWGIGAPIPAAYCRDLRLGANSDWRVPTSNELTGVLSRMTVRAEANWKCVRGNAAQK